MTVGAVSEQEVVWIEGLAVHPLQLDPDLCDSGETVEDESSYSFASPSTRTVTMSVSWYCW